MTPTNLNETTQAVDVDVDVGAEADVDVAVDVEVAVVITRKCPPLMPMINHIWPLPTTHLNQLEAHGDAEQPNYELAITSASSKKWHVSPINSRSLSPPPPSQWIPPKSV